MSESSEKSNPRHYDPEGPRGILRKGPDGEGLKRWWPLAILVAVVLVASGWWVTRSPIFQARRVEVSGTAHLTRADVIRLSGIGKGTNVFWLHAAAVERRVERSPWVADATVSRSLPSTIRIEVRERSPVGEVKDGTSFVVVAADGTVLRRSATDGGLPRLLLDTTPSSSPGHLGPTAWVAGGMSPWLRTHVRSVSLTADGSVVVQLHSGVSVFYGDATAIVAKDQALAAVLRWAITGHKPLESVDVSAPLAPTARLNVYVPPVVVALPPTAQPSPSAGPSPSPSASPSPAPSQKPSSSAGRHRAIHAANRIKKHTKKG